MAVDALRVSVDTKSSSGIDLGADSERSPGTVRAASFNSSGAVRGGAFSSSGIERGADSERSPGTVRGTFNSPGTVRGTAFSSSNAARAAAFVKCFEPTVSR